MIHQYIDFIITQMFKDSYRIQIEYGWNFLIIPYFYWMFLFLFKYLILTLPVWAPFNIMSVAISKILRALLNKK